MSVQTITKTGVDVVEKVLAYDTMSFGKANPTDVFTQQGLPHNLKLSPFMSAKISLDGENFYPLTTFFDATPPLDTVEFYCYADDENYYFLIYDSGGGSAVPVVYFKYMAYVYEKQ